MGSVTVWVWSQAAGRVLQPPEEGGRPGAARLPEEALPAAQQNQQHRQPGPLPLSGDAGVGLQSDPGTTRGSGGGRGHGAAAHLCLVTGHREPRRTFLLTEFVPRHQ